MRSRLLLSLIFFLVLGVNYCFADFAQKDIEVFSRAIGFLDKAIQYPARVYVIYDAQIPKTERAAKDILEKLDRKNAPALYRPTLANTRALADIEGIKDIDIAFIPAGMQGQYETIKTLLTAKGVLTVSSDRSCVEADACVISVQSQPKVKIYVSRTASGLADIQFQQAFRMMITEY